MDLLNRRNFLNIAGTTAAMAALPFSSVFSMFPPIASDRKLRVGVVGGRFGRGFYFNEHPNCTVEAVSDLDPERKKALMETYKCDKSYDSLEELIKDPKIEAVGIFTGAPDHAQHVIKCLKAGKHVLCAVPAVMSLEEAHHVLREVQRSGLTYMMAETSVFKPITMYAKKMFDEGQFGQIIGGAAQYYHPGLEVLFFEKDGSKTWRHGLAPMNYPTHSTSYFIHVTGERFTNVSCLGWGDGDPILKNNRYNNPFWKETAFLKTNKGTPFELAVAWKGAIAGTDRGEWIGDKMSLYGSYKGQNTHTVTVSDEMKKEEGGFAEAEVKVQAVVPPLLWKTDLLPEAMRHNTPHAGSHVFITHEFIGAVINNRKPVVDIYEALAYTVPGIVAHQSALRGGESLKIPSFDK